MYAVTGEWGHRDCTKLFMRDRGVKKEAGRSWIEVRNTVHAFFVGDRLHPLVDEIYNYLDELTKKVAAIGYVPDQSCLWNEVELRQKDPTAQIHSERLAVAFGLLSLPDIIPLHVMKNLRVCNDCHNWIKFISKVVDRPIIKHEEICKLSSHNEREPKPPCYRIYRGRKGTFSKLEGRRRDTSYTGCASSNA
ncbi:hypothetical protein SASPL_149503 [Salvia splendens]|uniref:DYW domain-containing protein n=1 Tax=Salvia splendens TaxID=180675 RepID=A0A8X8WCB8_SALSN|nr:hypothetical protein SASPL_149503 [Salvia splendens]